MSEIKRTKSGFEYTKDNDPDKPYIALKSIRYYSKRYNKYVRIWKGDRSDGATGAMDITSLGWWVHDNLCENGVWADGTEITNWQASRVLSDILWSEGRWVRAFGWLFPTFLFGGSKIKADGLA